jgi:hypothetical protein
LNWKTGILFLVGAGIFVFINSSLPTQQSSQILSFASTFIIGFHGTTGIWHLTGKNLDPVADYFDIGFSGLVLVSVGKYWKVTLKQHMTISLSVLIKSSIIMTQPCYSKL